MNIRCFPSSHRFLFFHGLILIHNSKVINNWKHIADWHAPLDATILVRQRQYISYALFIFLSLLSSIGVLLALFFLSINVRYRYHRSVTLYFFLNSFFHYQLRGLIYLPKNLCRKIGVPQDFIVEEQEKSSKLIIIITIN